MNSNSKVKDDSQIKSRKRPLGLSPPDSVPSKKERQMIQKPTPIAKKQVIEYKPSGSLTNPFKPKQSTTVILDQSVEEQQRKFREDYQKLK